MTERNNDRQRVVGKGDMDGEEEMAKKGGAENVREVVTEQGAEKSKLVRDE